MAAGFIKQVLVSISDTLTVLTLTYKTVRQSVSQSVSPFEVQCAVRVPSSECDDGTISKFIKIQFRNKLRAD